MDWSTISLLSNVNIVYICPTMFVRIRGPQLGALGLRGLKCVNNYSCCFSVHSGIMCCSNSLESRTPTKKTWRHYDFSVYVILFWRHVF
jgi:hypothetical protein